MKMQELNVELLPTNEFLIDPQQMMYDSGRIVVVGCLSIGDISLNEDKSRVGVFSDFSCGEDCFTLELFIFNNTHDSLLLDRVKLVSEY
jgi:hypothetical protein